MSASSGIAPRRRMGAGYVFHDTPSALVARKSASVVHEPGTFPLNIAQYSCRDESHCTSRCQGYTPAWVSATVVGEVHTSPSVDRRSSTVVLLLVHPAPPAFTVHIS